MADMMHFDTHQFARKLKTAGFGDEQVDVLIGLAVESTPKELVTKSDLKSEMNLLEHRLTLKIGGMIVGAVAIFAAIGRFLPNVAP
ncbi:DUF1640 domain-containing protein [Haematobacter genomosp. 1]|uniref:DUF1640 domain-containing protein n=1 Tax=Haematobacter genomosp. 1 TaxID=366618 RepID=A0A212A6U2_9RHOB|nr:DUF1640 domain-containing protein [Haematobacter genomosp. 1]OWJ75035.1 DUF1640 domain-containing protein [Haematobacter genomosp. 1]